jgi:hypothetical protein
MKRSTKIIIFIAVVVVILMLLWNKSENMTDYQKTLKCKWTDENNQIVNITAKPCTSCNICQVGEKINLRNDNCKDAELNMGIKYVDTKSCSL